MKFFNFTIRRLCSEQRSYRLCHCPPTVPINTGRLRLTVTTSHTQQDLQTVIETLPTLPTVTRL